MAPKHWSKEEKCIQHVEKIKIIVPYVKAESAEVGLLPDQKSLPIFNVFKGQKRQLFNLFRSAHLIPIYICACKHDKLLLTTRYYG